MTGLLIVGSVMLAVVGWWVGCLWGISYEQDQTQAEGANRYMTQVLAYGSLILILGALVLMWLA